MQKLHQRPRVVILVKALPQPSKRYGETVCCAGVTPTRTWLRLYPIRFRHLHGAQSFSRWDWVSFRYRRPTRDSRAESCHVFEDTIQIEGQLQLPERSTLLNQLVAGSAKDLEARGQSLGLIRPRNSRFIVRRKRPTEIAFEKASYSRAAQQGNFFDDQLAELEPSPYKFSFQFDDDAGRHEYQNGDWEAHTMFWRERNRTSEAEAIRWMDSTFNELYPKRGMVFAIGNQAKRPRTWQLLGVIRLDESRQFEMPI
jgi:hypothetical protein